MSDYIPVSKTHHAKHGWRTPTNYNFARTLTRTSVVVDEIEHIIPLYPLAFQSVATEPKTFELIAVLSPTPDKNLLVKEDGSWLTGYIPSQLRSYPFRLLPLTESTDHVVCFDQDSNLMDESDSPEVHPFFNGKREPSKQFSAIMHFLQQLEQRREVTQNCVDALAEEKLIVPWPLSLQTTEGKKMGVPGLFHVDRARLQKLSGTALERLHHQGALAVAYAQSLSEQRVKAFGRLLALSASNEKTPDKLVDVFADNEEALNFDVFKK